MTTMSPSTSIITVSALRRLINVVTTRTSARSKLAVNAPVRMNEPGSNASSPLAPEGAAELTDSTRPTDESSSTRVLVAAKSSRCPASSATPTEIQTPPTSFGIASPPQLVLRPPQPESTLDEGGQKSTRATSSLLVPWSQARLLQCTTNVEEPRSPGTAARLRPMPHQASSLASTSPGISRGDSTILICRWWRVWLLVLVGSVLLWCSA